MQKESIFKYTGNPFVDSGLFSLMRLARKGPDDFKKSDLKEQIIEIYKLYNTTAWNKNMHSIFPNSPLVHNSVDNSKYMDYLENLTDKIDFLGKEGNCIACGKRNTEKKALKSNIPLTGSGKLVNYFSHGVEGADYCPNCTLLTQFSPLFLYRCGGKFLLMHSNSNKLLKYWAKKSLKHIDNQIMTNKYTGCFNESFKRPENAMFKIIQDIALKSKENWKDENPSITFYYFTNYNLNAELDIFYLPSNVFNFLIDIPSEEKNNWYQIVRNGYKYVDWEKVKDEEDYKNHPNSVYNKLLNNKSILKFFIKYKSKMTLCGWRLLVSYMTMVRNMEKERLESIKCVGDLLSDYIQTNDDISSLDRIERASNYNSFRNVLRKIIKKRISLHLDEPLFTFDDYVKYMFPEGNLTWKETQDLIIFRIYENLHTWLVENKSKDLAEEE